MSLPPLLAVADIHARLQAIFPEGTANRKGVSFSRPAEGLTLAGDGATVKNRGRLPWDFAMDVYRYVSSPAMEEHVSDEAIDAAISTMLERGVAPGYCDENGDCEFGGSRKAGKKLRKATCEAEFLKNNGRVLNLRLPGHNAERWSG